MGRLVDAMTELAGSVLIADRVDGGSSITALSQEQVDRWGASDSLGAQWMAGPGGDTMVKGVPKRRTLFVEGGAKGRADLNAEARKGFKQLMERACPDRMMPRVEVCGDRRMAFEAPSGSWLEGRG